MYLFDIASRHMAWLAQRQMVTAANVANANTPGYRAREINPFASYLEGPSVALARTSPLHLAQPEDTIARAGTRQGTGWESTHSGNTVSIEKELMNASSANRMMNIDATITRSFHRMILSSVKV